MHRPSVPVFRLTVFLFALVTVVVAASAAPISGRVVDPDNRPVANARILISTPTGTLHTATTLADGRFSMEGPEAGRLVVRIAAEGFRAEAITVDATTSATDLGTIRLNISALAESIVVSAAHVETPLSQVGSSVTVITGAEVASRQLHSVADVLRAVPGLTLVSTGGLGTNTGLFTRGGESNYTLAVIDGVPANAFGGDFDFSQVSTENIDRIEVVRGPQSALFGSNAIGGVVRIVTRSGGPPAAHLTAEGGHYGTGRVSAATNGAHRAFEWGASFDQLRSDGMNDERTTAGDVIVNDDYERRTGTLSAGWRDGGAWLRANVRHSSDERGFPGPFGTNPIGAFDGIDAISRGDNRRSLVSLATSRPLSSRVRVQGQLGYNRIESDFHSRFGGSESFSRRWIGRMQTDVTVRPGIDLSAGAELQRERAGSTFITGASASQVPVKRFTTGYFGEARWNWQDRFFATTGLRVEDINREELEPSATRPVLQSDTVVSVNPRVSAAWVPGGGRLAFTKVRGAVATGIRPPDAFELAFTDNPELRPERNLSAEVGLDQAFAAGLALIEATAFYNKYDDLIVTVGSFSGSSRYQTDNISNARTRGLEVALTLRGRVPARRPIDVGARIGYTRLATEILAVDQDSAAPPPFVVGQPLLRRPDHQFFADLTASIGAVSAFLRGGGRSAALDVEPSFGTFGGLFDARGYHVWNAGAAWRVSRWATITGRVENLFDRSYEEALGFPALGRRATVGLRLAAGR